MILRRRHLKTVIVTLKTGEAFRGALWQHDRDAWVLRSAQLLRAGDGEQVQATSVDGEVILLTANIAYTNRPPA